MRLFLARLGAAAIFGGIVLFGWVVGTTVETGLDPYLPKDWQRNLVLALAVVGVVFLLDRVQELQRNVKHLTGNIERLRKQTGFN